MLLRSALRVGAPREPGSVLLRSQFAPQEQGRCSSGALAHEEPGSVLLRSALRVGAPQEPGSVLLRSALGVGAPQEPGSVLFRSQFAPQEQGRCSSGALAHEEPRSVLLRSALRV